MAKKTITAVLICILLFTTFIVPSSAWVNGYLVNGENTAAFYIPPYYQFAFDVRYIPSNVVFADLHLVPLIKFETISTWEITGTQESEIFYFQDETMNAPAGHYYGLAMYEYEYDGDYLVVEFCVAEFYDDTNGVAILVDVVFEPYPMETEFPSMDIYYFANDVISDPENMPEYFQSLYPMLPLVWSDYSKIVNGTYLSGYADGERKGRDKINLSAVNEAFERGKAQGFDEGYNEGFYDAGGKNYFKELVDAVIFAPVNGIVEMMNFDFFGINVANIFLAFLTILILAGILALIARFIL